jgi:hypothetical protein
VAGGLEIPGCASIMTAFQKRLHPQLAVVLYVPARS